MAERRWRDAAALYEQVLAQRPGMAALRVQLAHACKELGWLDVAASHYAEAARSQPGDVDPLLHLGHMARGAGDFSTAAEWYQRALVIDPGCAAALSGIESTAGAASAPIDRRRHIESRHFADNNNRSCRVHWDLSAPPGGKFEPERRWFSELGRALAERCDCVPIRFDAERGRYERCGPAGERLANADLAQPSSASLLVTMPGLAGSAAATAWSVGEAQAQLRARIITLVPGGYASSDAILISDSSCILAPPLAAAALRDNQWRLGGSTASVITIDSAESLQLASAVRTIVPSEPASIAPWLEALDDLRQPGRLARFAARPLRRLVEFGRFYPLPANMDNTARRERLAGAYLTPGADWNGGQHRGSGLREIRVLSAGAPGDPLVCRLMLRRNTTSPAATAAAEWRTLEAEASRTEHSHMGAVEKVFHLGAALADVQSTEIVGLVFHPRSQDHHWFEFVDRLSRHAEPLAISA
jgi:hypothetical protein